MIFYGRAPTSDISAIKLLLIASERMTPIRKLSTKHVPPKRVEEVLSLLTKESFVGGQSAYQLDDDTYSVDAGGNDIVTKNLDVLALSEEVERDSESGKLSRELLAQGQTLYSKNHLFPEDLERIIPDGKKSLGHWRDGEFAEELCLLW